MLKMARFSEFRGRCASVWAAAKGLWRELGVFTHFAKAETRLVGPHVKQLVQGFEGKTLTRKMVDRVAILPGKSQATVMNCSAYLNWVLDLK